MAIKEHLIEGWFRAGPAKHTHRQVASHTSWLVGLAPFLECIYRHLGQGSHKDDARSIVNNQPPKQQ